MKYGFPTGATFVDCIKQTSQLLETGVRKHGRTVMGLGFLAADFVLGESNNPLLKAAAYGCFAPSSVIFIGETWMKKNEHQQGVIDIGKKQFNMNKLSYGLLAVGCGVLCADAAYETGAALLNSDVSIEDTFQKGLRLITGYSAYGCAQAASEDPPVEQAIDSDKTVFENVKNDNEVKGVTKFLAENLVVILSRIGKKDRPEILCAYAIYTASLALGVLARGLNIKKIMKDRTTNKNQMESASLQ